MCVCGLNFNFVPFNHSIGTDDEDHEYDCLGAWGPRFDKLANMYGPEHQQDLDEL